jgi:hypothetical protein
VYGEIQVDGDGILLAFWSAMFMPCLDVAFSQISGPGGFKIIQSATSPSLTSAQTTNSPSTPSTSGAGNWRVIPNRRN